MFNSSQFESLAKKLCAALPSHLQTIESEIQHQFKDILTAAFARMELLTREEFDVQTKVLARTREKVESLQKQVDSLLQVR
jgi:BMFP domain-containing protein YqiC